MSQYNLGSLSSSGNAIQIVNAGDPETLILNHSTKNTIYIGETNAVGSGNLLDATPLDPYASIVVNGTADVFAVAANPSQPATVYTYQNSIAWTPKAIQPNIVDPQSPATVTAPGTILTLNVPPTAQALAIYGLNVANITSILISGVQSNIVYYNGPPPPASSSLPYLWVPVLSDADTQVTVNVVVSSGSRVLELVWIMSGPPPVTVPGSQNVNIQSVDGTTLTSMAVPVSNQVGGTLAVVENSKQMFVNQVAVMIDQTLASGASAVILPASAGVQYFIHEVRLEEVNAAPVSTFINLQDTSGATFANIVNTVFGVPSTGFFPPLGPCSFKGMPIGTGLGFQIKNGSANNSRFVGYVAYSK